MVEICKIIQFPNLNKFSTSKEPIKKEIILNEIKQLLWENPEAFFTLIANYLSDCPVEMEEEVEARLRDFNLINDSEHSPAVVHKIITSITEESNKMVNTM